MSLAIRWPHDPGENRSPTRAGGPMTLAIRWSHEAGENARLWPHEPGDWHARNIDFEKPGAIDAETIAIKSACTSNDAHVVALARISGARVVATKDIQLHVDIKNKTLLDNPRGSVYQDESHAHLLAAAACQPSR